MRSQFYSLLQDLAQRTQLPFDSHVQGSRVSFRVDKDYRFALELDNSEDFIIFQCIILDKKIDFDPVALLNWNFTAVLREGCFVALDPTDSIVLMMRLPLQSVHAAQVIEIMQHLINVADRFARGDFSKKSSSHSHGLHFFPKV